MFAGKETGLVERAVHVFFLRRFGLQRANAADGPTLGELKTHTVVSDYVRPATSKSRTNYVDCLCQGNLPPKHQLDWCPGGVLTDVEGKPSAFGPSTFFVSHVWSYTFYALLSLIDRHYCSLPETEGGKVFVPVYYWVDILAVTQHFTGDFKDHPDSQFESVISASRVVLFSMYPWRAPIAPTRVWCLYEALLAVQAEGVELEVLLDTADSRDTGVQTVLTVAGSVDVRSAQATVPGDKAFIMARIREGVGVEGFNAELRARLKEALLDATVVKAVTDGNSDAVVNLAKVGGWRGNNGVLDVPGVLPCGNSSHVVALLSLCSPATGMPRCILLSGRGLGGGAVAAPRARDKDEDKGGMWPTHAQLVGRDKDRDNTKSRELYVRPADTPSWRYLPLSNSLLAAVGRLLQALQQAPSGFNASMGGGGGARSSTSGGPGPGLTELWLEPGPAVAVVDPFVGDHPLHNYRPEFRALQSALAREPDWIAMEKAAERRYRSYTEHEAAMREARMAELRRRHAAALSKAAADLPERLKLRSELWSGLAANSTLTTLALHWGALSAGQDVEELGRILRQHRTLRELLVINVEPDQVAKDACSHPDTGPLTRALLGAALGSRTLERLVLVPRRLALLPDLAVPAATAWDMGGGAALREVVVAPVALAAAAMRQMGELLASMPDLQGGCVGARRAPPRFRIPAHPSDPPCAPAAECFDLAPVLQLLDRCAHPPNGSACDGDGIASLLLGPHTIGAGGSQGPNSSGALGRLSAGPGGPGAERGASGVAERGAGPHSGSLSGGLPSAHSYGGPLSSEARRASVHSASVSGGLPPSGLSHSHLAGVIAAERSGSGSAFGQYHHHVHARASITGVLGGATGSAGGGGGSANARSSTTGTGAGASPSTAGVTVGGGSGSGGSALPASQRAAALTHFVALATCYAAVEHTPAGEQCVVDEDAAEALHVALKRDKTAQLKAMEEAQEGSPPEYLDNWKALCPKEARDKYWTVPWKLPLSVATSAHYAASNGSPRAADSGKPSRSSTGKGVELTDSDSDDDWLSGRA